MLYSKSRRCSPCGDGVIRRLYLEGVGGNVGEKKMAITMMIVVPAVAVMMMMMMIFIYVQRVANGSLLYDLPSGMGTC